VLAPIAGGKAAQGHLPGSRFGAWLKRFSSLVSVRRSERRLRLCEMLPLGEKRFVAVVEYGAERFVLAGTPQRISLLKRLPISGEGLKAKPNGEPDEQ
jgi:flagellar biogenesis protein FliO